MRVKLQSILDALAAHPGYLTVIAAILLFGAWVGENHYARRAGSLATGLQAAWRDNQAHDQSNAIHRAIQRLVVPIVEQRYPSGPGKSVESDDGIRDRLDANAAYMSNLEDVWNDQRVMAGLGAATSLDVGAPFEITHRLGTMFMKCQEIVDDLNAALARYLTFVNEAKRQGRLVARKDEVSAAMEEVVSRFRKYSDIAGGIAAEVANARGELLIWMRGEQTKRRADAGYASTVASVLYVVGSLLAIVAEWLKARKKGT